MSKSDIIKNLVISLKKKVDDNDISEDMMLTIVSDTLQQFSNFSQSQVLTPSTTATNSERKKIMWGDLSSDDEITNEDSNEAEITANVINSPPQTPTSTETSVTKRLPAISNVIARFTKNCENTLLNFIKNYKVNHFDSAKNVLELNLIIIRILGIDFNKTPISAFTTDCWFMRNTKCYYKNCLANEYFMCTYAHPKSSTGDIQYTCIHEKGYTCWSDNYYKCLKLKYDNDIVTKTVLAHYKNTRLPLESYEKVPVCVIEWYQSMFDLLTSCK